MDIGKIVKSIIVGGSLAFLIGCGSGKPTIKEVRDFTGDGIQDILIDNDEMRYSSKGNYLFIGKEDGSFIRTQEKKHEDGVKYFLADDGTAYFFDGEFYKPSPKLK